ncbi:MAG: hypothetical protein KAR20_20980, partial [Candidatus Heimdallarchaeota archaeon]|nr:hypothetical protein [Candidatus Heimdallarchaeota archaeon]
RIYLIPGEHTLTVKGGTVRTSSFTLTVKGSWRFKVNIEANNNYKIDYQEMSGGKVKPIRVFIKNKTTGKEVGTVQKILN